MQLMAKYDAIVDLQGSGTLLKIQIKGTRTNSLNFLGGWGSGQQIDRKAKSRNYKYKKEDCDFMLIKLELS